MRLVNLDGHLQVAMPGGLVDIAASHGNPSGDPEELHARWTDFVVWYEENRSALAPTDAGDIDPARVGSPSRRPRQVFAVGLNHAPHAAQAGVARPKRR